MNKTWSGQTIWYYWYDKVAIWNVRGLGTKEIDLNKILKDKKTDVVVIIETKKKLKATKGFKDYTMVYSGVPQSTHACCGVLINNKCKNKLHITHT